MCKRAQSGGNKCGQSFVPERMYTTHRSTYQYQCNNSVMCSAHFTSPHVPCLRAHDGMRTSILCQIEFFLGMPPNHHSMVLAPE